MNCRDPPNKGPNKITSTVPVVIKSFEIIHRKIVHRKNLTFSVLPTFMMHALISEKSDKGTVYGLLWNLNTQNNVPNFIVSVVVGGGSLLYSYFHSSYKSHGSVPQSSLNFLTWYIFLEYVVEYEELLSKVEDRAGLLAIKALHQQLDDDNDGTIEPSETGDFIKADLKVIYLYEIQMINKYWFVFYLVNWSAVLSTIVIMILINPLLFRTPVDQ